MVRGVSPAGSPKGQSLVLCGASLTLPAFAFTFTQEDAGVFCFSFAFTFTSGLQEVW